MPLKNIANIRLHNIGDLEIERYALSGSHSLRSVYITDSRIHLSEASFHDLTVSANATVTNAHIKWRRAYKVSRLYRVISTRCRRMALSTAI